MFRFEHPFFLNLLWALPLAALLLVAHGWWRRRAMARLGDAALLQRLLLGFSGWRLWLKNALFLLALGLLAFSWANPQRGARRQMLKQQSADIFIALDISQSMLAQDVAPSRLELAKVFVQKLIQALEGERVGLIYFAGDAFLQMPLSTDYEAASMFARSAGPELITAQGTNIPAAIDLAIQSFAETPGGGRALILITDGENHDEDAVARAEAAFEDGIVVFAVGAGTPEGAPIPQPFSAGGNTFKRDEKGEIVRTRLETKLLIDLTRAGGGAAFNLNQGDAAIKALRNEVSKLQKRELEMRSYTEFESYFQWLLLPALLLLVVEQWLSWRQPKQ